MKTLHLSSDDIQNFSKLIYDSKSVQLATAGHVAAMATTTAGGNASNDANMMALHYYYLKQPSSGAILAAATQQHQQAPPQVVRHSATQTVAQQHAQQLLVQSQTQLKQLQLKQPTIHQQQTSAFHHHPYYQQQPPQQQSASHTNANSLHLSSSQHAQSVAVHALNQNSNFSAASHSTGGTASSHAPTQQSNTTGSSNLSPPGVSANARNTPASHNASSATAQLRNLSSGSSSVGQAKKLRTEPVLSQIHQNERLNFANTHIVWGEEHWKRVVFMDERKFNLDGPDGFSYYFHDLRNYERTLSQRPRGNSVYIYMVITSGGPVFLDVSVAKQKPETCIEAILRERPNIVSKLGGNKEFVLQDHNWTTNALPSASEWLQAEGIKTQKWPTIAHDLNIMENVWGWLIREVFDGGRKFSRKDDLIFRIREAWGRIPMDFVNNLYSTLPERITELYYTRGVYTNC